MGLASPSEWGLASPVQARLRRCFGGNAGHHKGPRKPLAPPGAPFPFGEKEKGTGGAHAEVKQQGGAALATSRHSGARRRREPGIHNHKRIETPTERCG